MRLAVAAINLNKRHWNTIRLDGSLAGQLVRDDLIEDSYDLVVSGLRRAREQLGWARVADDAGSARHSR